MKNVRNVRDNFSRILDEFLKKAMNVILKARITNNTEKDQMLNTKVYLYNNISFFLLKM